MSLHKPDPNNCWLGVKQQSFTLLARPCNEGSTKCADGLECIWSSSYCNGYAHCEDESDESEEVCRGKVNAFVSIYF
jgi:hypothetical protein